MSPTDSLAKVAKKIFGRSMTADQNNMLVAAWQNFLTQSEAIGVPVNVTLNMAAYLVGAGIGSMANVPDEEKYRHMDYAYNAMWLAAQTLGMDYDAFQRWLDTNAPKTEATH